MKMPPVRAPQMTRHGTRIYCHHMDEDQQKWVIDMLGHRISLVIASVLGPIAVEANVRSIKDNKAILDIHAIRTPTASEARQFLEGNKRD